MKVNQLPKTIGGTVRVTDALSPKAGDPVSSGGSEEAWVHSENGKQWIVVTGAAKNYRIT